MKFVQETTIPAKVETAEYELCDVEIVARFATGKFKVNGLPNRNDLEVEVTPPGCATQRHRFEPGHPTYELFVGFVQGAQAADPNVVMKPVPPEPEPVDPETKGNAPEVPVPPKK